MSQTNPALAAIFEFVKQLANFALDHAQALTQNPAPWAVDVGARLSEPFTAPFTAPSHRLRMCKFHPRNV